ncbi:MAG: restriction endonuclease subunit S, partial [Cetobacterium sp.]
MNKIPKLRFPEFSGEWEEKRSKDILTLKGGYAFKSDKFLNEKSIYQVIKMGNVYQNNLLLDKNPSYLSKITEREKEYLLKKGDVIITLTGTVGKRDFGYSFQINNEGNLLLNQRLALLRANPNTSDNKFLRYILLKDQ